MSNEPNPSNEPIESELLRDDPSFADIVIPFVQGLAERLRVMEESINAQDLDALRVAAHQLKGAGGGYGFPSLSDHAAELEQQARQAKIDDCTQAVEDLKQLIARIVIPPEG